MASSFNKFNCFVEDLAEGVHDLDTDQLYIALTNSAPSASNTVLANITEISGGTGYTAGGALAALSSSAQVCGYGTAAVCGALQQHRDWRSANRLVGLRFEPDAGLW
jgi:hypothetical protein